jgi:apolipoprotein N-acyltransferase
MSNTDNKVWFRVLLAVFFGASTSFSFAPYSVWPLAIISPAVLLLLSYTQKPKRAFLIGWLWGMGLFGLGLSWVHVSIDTFGGVPRIVGVFLLTLLSAYLALFPACYSWLVSRCWKQNLKLQFFIASPVLWLLTESVRGWLFTGFPWLWLGYSQIDSPLAGYAPVGGVELLNFVVALTAAGCAYLWVTRKAIALLPMVFIFTVGFTLNSIEWVVPKAGSETKLALIQGNIAQEKKWLPSERWPTLEKYTELTQNHWDADIIIWPEAAIPAFEYELPQFFSTLDKAGKKTHTALITGVLNRVNRTTFYNSVLVLGENGKGEYQYNIDSLYHKHHLLPFGEFVPFETLLRPIAPLFNLPNSSFSRGNYIQDNLLANHRHLASALCYEIIFGEQVRANITNQTDFILTLSNDAWFGSSVGPLQHMEIARMRALELGKPLIRSTNTGVTAVTDEKGKIIAKIPQFKTGVLTTTIRSMTGETPYLRFGAWPIYIFAVLAMFITWLVQRKKTK